jgi:hypothetical protein
VHIGSVTKFLGGAIDFSIDGPVTISSAMFCGNRAFSSPKSLVGPVLQFGGEIALGVIAAERRTAHRRQREASLVVPVDDIGERKPSQPAM